jgi:hypothetical protein
MGEGAGGSAEAARLLSINVEEDPDLDMERVRERGAPSRIQSSTDDDVTSVGTSAEACLSCGSPLL